MKKQLAVLGDNKRRGSLLVAVVAFWAIVAFSVAYVSGANATPPSGVTVVPLAPVAQFDEIKEHVMTDKEDGEDPDEGRL